MGACKSKVEPVEYIDFLPLRYVTPTHTVETRQKDPVITSPSEDKELSLGDISDFSVQYQVFKGPVQITVTMKNSSGEKLIHATTTDSFRSADFSFRIYGATDEHAGKYTVRIKDEGLPLKNGANPVETSWKVQVKPTGHELYGVCKQY